MQAVLRHLHSRISFCDHTHVGDGELLTRFINERDERAFEGLLQRHGAMVLAVCRRLLRNPEDVTDAFQASWLVLVRKARSIRPPDMVAAWLHGVARQTSLKLRASNAKRSARERQVSTPLDQGLTEALPDDVGPVLDEELARLPDNYRVAVLLCDVEGKTRTEAARRLRWPEGTLSSRLARGRAMLARRLTRRGVTLSVGALAMLPGQGTAAQMPPLLITTTLKAASVLARGMASGVVSAKVVVLMEGVSGAMLITKLKTAGVVLVVASVVGLGGGMLSSRSVAQQGTTPTPTGETGKPVEAKADVKRLQGVWNLKASMGRGADERIRGLTQLAIHGDLWNLRCDTESIGSIARLNPATSPNRVDLLIAGRTAVRGIYLIDGDRLRLAWCVERLGERPHNFTSEGSGTIVYEFEREEPNQKGDVSPKPPEVTRDKVRALMRLYRDHYRGGRYAEAEQAAAKALELDPDDPAIEAALDVIHLRLGMAAARKDEMFPDGRAHDFGKLTRGTVVQHQFTLVNTSKSVLDLRTARVSCGCLKAGMTKTILQAGEKTKLMVELDTTRFSGPKTILIYLQDDERFFFTVKAESVPGTQERGR